MYDKLSEAERGAFLQVAGALSVNPQWLYDLINFESGWNPAAHNSKSSARGLIQWVDSSAIEDGYTSSIDLVTRNPDIITQLAMVYRRLSRFKPFPDEQALYMAVFYPAARYWPDGKEFPDSVKAVNPGISTPADYVNFVKVNAALALLPFIALGGFLAYVLYQSIVKGI